MGMETKATWKRVGKAVLAIVLVIALSLFAFRSREFTGAGITARPSGGKDGEFSGSPR